MEWWKCCVSLRLDHLNLLCIKSPTRICQTVAARQDFATRCLPFKDWTDVYKTRWLLWKDRTDIFKARLLLWKVSADQHCHSLQLTLQSQQECVDGTDNGYQTPWFRCSFLQLSGKHDKTASTSTYDERTVCTSKNHAWFHSYVQWSSTEILPNSEQRQRAMKIQIEFWIMNRMTGKQLCYVSSQR